MSTLPTVLITGADGFVGTALRRHLAGQAEIVALAGDIRDAAAVGDQVQLAKPDAVIHLAAIASPGVAAKQPDEAWMVNVMGTFHLAHAVQLFAPDARLVFAGSSEAYGESLASSIPVSEHAPLRPLTPYGATKAAADIMLEQMSRQGLRVVRFRPFNHTGPGQAPLYVISSFARQIVRIERGVQAPTMRVGNLSIERDFLDVRDVVRAYSMAALNDDPALEKGAFNLATGRPRAIATMLELMIGMARTSVETEVDPALLRPHEIQRIAGDPARAAAALDWCATIPLEETLHSVLGWWRDQADDRLE